MQGTSQGSSQVFFHSLQAEEETNKPTALSSKFAFAHNQGRSQTHPGETVKFSFYYPERGLHGRLRETVINFVFSIFHTQEGETVRNVSLAPSHLG